MKAQYIAELEPCDTPNYRFEVTRREFAWLGAGLLLTLRRAESAPLVRIHLADGGTVTLLTGKVDMGQGSRTILTQVVAEEMSVSPARVRVVMGDTDLVPDDGGTWGSLTTPETVPVVRKAAIEARRLTDPSAGDQPVAPEQWKVCGTSLPPVRSRDIVTGRLKFAADHSMKDMLHAAVVRPPAYRATLKRFAAPSAVRTVRDGNLLGVLAESRAKAVSDASAIDAQWETESLPSKAAMLAAFREKSIAPKPGEGGRYPSLIVQGDVSAALARASVKHEAQFTVANIAHVPLEPRAAIAEWKDGKLTVWSGTQAPFLVRKELAAAFRIPEANVRVIAVEPGGAYGGKQRGECELEAAALARDVGRPVRLAWSRTEEFTASYCRPAGVLDMTAALDDEGRIVAWRHRNYNSGAASLKPPYAIPAYSCEFHRAESPVRHGSYRSLAGVANTFAREAFVDELAGLANVDPLTFRLRNTEDARLRNVLELAAERFGWGKSKRAGVACNIEKDARLALFVEMEGSRVTRAVAAVDPGAILNPDGVRNQVEGAIVQGLGGALFEELTFDTRHLTNTKLSRYRVPRFADAPAIEVILAGRRDVASAGFGEAPITVVAPAIAGALFAQTGRRARSLPVARA